MLSHSSPHIQRQSQQHRPANIAPPARRRQPRQKPILNRFSVNAGSAASSYPAHSNQSAVARRFTTRDFGLDFYQRQLGERIKNGIQGIKPIGGTPESSNTPKTCRPPTMFSPIAAPARRARERIYGNIAGIAPVALLSKRPHVRALRAAWTNATDCFHIQGNFAEPWTNLLTPARWGCGVAFH